MENNETTLQDVLRLIKEKRYQLDFDLDIPEQFKSNKEVIACVLENGNLAFEKLPKSAQENKEILVMIAAKDAYECQKFPDWAMDDMQIVLSALNKDAGVFEHVSTRLRSDRNVVMTALKGGHYATLQHVTSEELKNDKELLRLAIQGHGQAFGNLSEKWRNDPELIELALEGNIHACNCFEHFPEKYRDDKTIALKAMGDDPSCFQYLSERLRDDDELALMALKKRGMYMEYASPRIRDSKDMALVALKDGGDIHWVFGSVSERLKKDKDLAMAAMQSDTRFLDRLDPVFHKDPDIIKVCMEERQYFDGSCYKYFDESFRSDRAIALRMSTGRNFPLDAVPEPFLQDKEIVSNAVKSEASNFKFLAPGLLSDLSFLKELHRLNDGILYHMDENLKAQLFSTTIQSVEHYGKRIQYTLVLDDGYVKDEKRPVQRATVLQDQKPIVELLDFPVLTYEEDGPVGSYLSVRYRNNFVLLGQFVFFVKTNSGEETFTHSLSRGGKLERYGPPPQANDNFLKHEVYLIPEGVTRIEYINLNGFPRLYYGRQHHLPKGVQLFPTEESYRTALTVLKQEKVHNDTCFTRLSDSVLEALPVPVDEIFGAARVYIDGFGWRFLIPHPEGALKSLEVLKVTEDRDDLNWIKSQSGTLSDEQENLLKFHFGDLYGV